MWNIPNQRAICCVILALLAAISALPEHNDEAQTKIQQTDSPFSQFLRKIFPNLKPNEYRDLDSKLRTILGNHHLYIEFLHQFAPNRWFKPLQDKIQRVQEIFRNPNQASHSIPFGCNRPGFTVLNPQNDDKVQQQPEVGGNSSHETSPGSKLFIFESKSRPNPHLSLETTYNNSNET